MNLGPLELVVILLIILLLFGAKKLPELAKSLGQSMRELRSGMSDEPKPEAKKEEEKKTEG